MNERMGGFISVIVGIHVFGFGVSDAGADVIRPLYCGSYTLAMSGLQAIDSACMAIGFSFVHINSICLDTTNRANQETSSSRLCPLSCMPLHKLNRRLAL